MIRPEYLDINKIITDKSILKLFQAVASHGGILRFVGGAVRDVLAGMKGFEIDGSHITLNSIVFQEEGTDRIDFVVADGDDITVNGCTFIGDLTKEDMDRVIYGVSSYGDKTQVLDSHFKNLRVPFYFTEHSATNGVATGNFITGCYKVDLEKKVEFAFVYPGKDMEG